MHLHYAGHAHSRLPSHRTPTSLEGLITGNDPTTAYLQSINLFSSPLQSGLSNKAGAGLPPYTAGETGKAPEERKIITKC